MFCFYKRLVETVPTSNILPMLGHRWSPSFSEIILEISLVVLVIAPINKQVRKCYLYVTLVLAYTYLIIKY